MNRRISNSKTTRHAMALMALTVLLGLALHPTSGAKPVMSPRQARLRLLFASSLFQSIKKNDALAAFKLWVETVGRNRGFVLTAEADSYDPLDEVETRIRDKTVDLVIFTSMDYLQIAQGGPMEPVFAAIRKPEAMFDDYVVVTRRDRNLTALPALRGKSVAFFQTGANLGRQWMDVTLGESGLGSVNDFFGSHSDSTKASSVVLPVFFGKLDAGVVNRSNLETMQEMNPQLAAQLQVLTNSLCLPESVICLHKDYTELREDVLQGLAELHREPHGQQLLLVFKINKLVPFKSEYLEGVRDLKARHSKMETLPEHLEARATAGGQTKP
jgi:ABC-type phosphate/phosphonate transport system substrate-binding protein